MIGLILVTVSLLLALAVYLYDQALPRPLPMIPYNPASLGKVFGDLPELFGAPNRRQFVCSHPASLGSPISQLLFPFASPRVCVADYHTVVDIITRRTREFDRGGTVRAVVGMLAPNMHMVMETRDDDFRRNRELIRDLTGREFLDKAAPIAYDQTALLVTLWREKMARSRGRAFEAANDFHTAILDSLITLVFGKEDGKSTSMKDLAAVKASNPVIPLDQADAPALFATARRDAEMEALLDIPSMLQVSESSPMPLVSQYLALLRPKHGRGWWHRRSLISRQTTRALERLKQGGGGTAIDYLLCREMNAAKRAGRNPDLYSPVIRDELLGFLLTGHETTAAFMSWWVKYMTRHQDVQARLRNELRLAHQRAVAEGRPPKATEITKTSIPYFDAVIEETLRLASVSPIITRTALCDTEILGYPIPEGTDLVLALTGPSMTQKAMPHPPLDGNVPAASKTRVPGWGVDVCEYNPDRWLKTQKEDGTMQEQTLFDPLAGPTLPFSGGPRICIGRKLASIMTRIQMTLLIWNFEFLENPGLNGDETVESVVNAPRDSYVRLKEVKV